MIPTWLEIFLVLQLLDKKPTHFGFSYSSFSFIFFNKETNWPILIFSDLFCFVVFGSRPHSVIIQGILKNWKTINQILAVYCSTHFSWCWLLFYATVTYKLLLRFTDSAFLIDILHSLSMNWPIKVQDDHKLHYSLQFFLKQNSFDHFDYNYALLFWNLDGMFFRMMSFCWFCKIY